ncbi:fatty acid elongase [Endogone sp. FLAS-F59071]|nr:fatty acid elongase [Endogone sp. FLAS-F59071]|eukprot:RUS16170.1 fatty acid elongase [Endogone sp. FLAS-F59071]
MDILSPSYSAMPEGILYPEYYDFFMNWKTPLVIAGIYTVAVTLLNPASSKLSRVVAKSSQDAAAAAKVSESSASMTAFVFVHNLILCVYSVITCIYMARGMVANYRHSESIKNAYCDKDSFLWNNSLGYWGYYFYLSKYYEIIDTVIILMKGRRSSLLQTYHHAGAMITMWAGIYYQTTPIWIFVLFNSFIHSIMYAYYALTSVGVNPPGKKYLTSMQITQFLVGTSFAVSYLFVPSCLRTPGQKFAVSVNVAYLCPLTYLFLDFARRTYGGGARKAKKVE